MGRSTSFLTTRHVLRVRDDRCIGLPEVGETEPAAIGDREGNPEAPAGRGTAVARDGGDDLTLRAREGDPDVDGIALAANKRPDFVELQVRRCVIGWIGRQNCRTQRWEFGSPFFSQAVTVFRDTPKVRSSPRRLLRS
jgi:hypothetical protein